MSRATRTKQILNNYKLTKLGRIPSGWAVKKFAEVFDFIPTNSFSRDQMGYNVSNGAIYNIHYGDIHATFEEQVLDFAKHQHQIPVLLDKGLKFKDEVFLKEGDLIIADASEDYDGVGECIEIKNIKKKKVLSGLHTVAARDSKKSTVDGFRSYLLKHPKVSIELKKLATGSKVYGVSKTNIAGLQLILPPLPEQQKIAQILSTWDKAIEKTEQLIAQKQQLKKGLMQQLLTGKVRFKEFVKSKKMKKTKLGMIPEDWEVVSIKEIGKVGAGGTPSTARMEYWGGDIRWMNSGELNLKYVYEVEGRITHEGLNNSSAKFLPKHCVLIGLAGQGRTRGTAAINMVELSTNQSVAFIEPDSKRVDYHFLFYNLDFRYEELRKLSTGEGGRGGLNLDIIKNIRLANPPLEEQKQIVNILSTLDNGIHKLQFQLDQFKVEKKGLMQELLKGEVRVKI